MYLTSGAKVSTSRLRTCSAPDSLYCFQSASVSSWEMRRRLPVSGFIGRGAPWGAKRGRGSAFLSSTARQAFTGAYTVPRPNVQVPALTGLALVATARDLREDAPTFAREATVLDPGHEPASLLVRNLELAA